MMNAISKNCVFLQQWQRGRATTLKAGMKLKGNGEETDGLKKTANGKADGISQSERVY